MSGIGNDVNDVADTTFGVLNNAPVASTTPAQMIASTWRLTLVVHGLLALLAVPMRRAGRLALRVLQTAGVCSSSSPPAT